MIGPIEPVSAKTTPKARGIDAVDDRAARDRRFAEIRPDARDIDGRDRRREIGEDRGQTDRHDRLEVASDRREARPADEIVNVDRAIEADAEEDEARDHRRPGRAIDAEPEAENQQRDR